MHFLQNNQSDSYLKGQTSNKSESKRLCLRACDKPELCGGNAKLDTCEPYQQHLIIITAVSRKPITAHMAKAIHLCHRLCDVHRPMCLHKYLEATIRDA